MFFLSQDVPTSFTASGFKVKKQSVMNKKVNLMKLFFLYY